MQIQGTIKIRDCIGLRNNVTSTSSWSLRLSQQTAKMAPGGSAPVPERQSRVHQAVIRRQRESRMEWQTWPLRISGGGVYHWL